jgi:hypothetical protein
MSDGAPIDLLKQKENREHREQLAQIVQRHKEEIEQQKREKAALEQQAKNEAAKVATCVLIVQQIEGLYHDSENACDQLQVTCDELTAKVKGMHEAQLGEREQFRAAVADIENARKQLLQEQELSRELRENLSTVQKDHEALQQELQQKETARKQLEGTLEKRVARTWKYVAVCLFLLMVALIALTASHWPGV